MLFLGFLSVLQLAFVPGYIVLSVFRFDQKSLSQTLVYSFALSLLVNYLLVYLLAALGLYQAATIYMILAVEWIYLGYLLYRAPRRLSIRIVNWPKVIYRTLRSGQIVTGVLTIAALALIAAYIGLLMFSQGQVFALHDAVFSWDRWAVEWFNNGLPQRTGYYPQLMPANWSLTYMIIQNAEVKMFAKSIMPLFPLGTLLLFFALATRGKETAGSVAGSVRAAHLLGLVICGLAFLRISAHLVDGYVDVPVAFFAFLTLYCLTEPPKEPADFNAGSMVLAFAFASAAALTKQSGLYILVVALVYAAGSLYRARARLPAKQVKGFVLLAFLMVLVGVFSWYGPKQVHMATGWDQSEVSYVTQDIYGGKGYAQRFTEALGLLSGGKEFLLIFLGLPLFAALFDREARWIVLGICLPYGLLWALFFSYDWRNLIFAVPFIAYAAALGLALSWRYCARLWQIRLANISR
jgi:hypothetical protein